MRTAYHLSTVLVVLLWLFVLPALPFMITESLLNSLENKIYD
jgi:hypothetical protein